MSTVSCAHNCTVTIGRTTSYLQFQTLSHTEPCIKVSLLQLSATQCKPDVGPAVPGAQARDAASQLEFLKEVGTAGVGSLQAPDLLYLQGLLAWKQGQDLFQVHSTATALAIPLWSACRSYMKAQPKTVSGTDQSHKAADTLWSRCRSKMIKADSLLTHTDVPHTLHGALQGCLCSEIVVHAAADSSATAVIKS